MPKRRRSRDISDGFYFLEEKIPENTHEPVPVASAENAKLPPVSTDVEIVPGPDNEDPPAPVENTQASDLDKSILEILGDDPTLIKSYGAEIQKDLAVRLEHCVTSGLSKEVRKELKENYLIPSNCKMVNAPVLNAEIKAAISDQTAKRDKAIEIKQSLLASAIAALSQALTRVLSASDKDSELIKILMDTSRLLCDCQYFDSITRRNFVLSTLKKDMRDQLQNSKVDTFLFGENFAETIKTAKAITKSGSELKAAPVPRLQSMIKKAMTSGSGPSKNLNWKGPFPARRQTEAPRTKEPAMARTRPSNSSRPSQQHRAPRNSRR
ncbi:hypothetical protein NE865_07340 [Phthorimaea operculella]|nr:hypothetical protein NE865_07340 [Phthorimaea operculella]